MASKDFFKENLHKAQLDILASQQADEALESLAKFVTETTQSTGMAIYYATIVFGEERLVALYDTESNKEKIISNFHHRKLNKEKGITEWVLEHNQWIIGRAMSQQGEDDGIYVNQSGNVVEIVSSKASAWTPPRGRDFEWATCFLPIQLSRDKTNAVLSFWQDAKKEYKPEDAEIGMAILPAITNCCQHILELEQAERKEWTQRQLTERIQSKIPPYQLKKLFLRDLFAFYSARCIVAFSKVNYRMTNNSVCYSADCVIQPGDRLKEAFEQFSVVLSSDILGDNQAIKGYVLTELTLLLKEHEATVRFFHFLPEERTFLLVLDNCRKINNVSLYLKNGDNQQDASLLDYVWPLYRVHKKAHLRESIEGLRSYDTENDKYEAADNHHNVSDYTRPVLKKIIEVTKADVAFIYLGIAGYMEIKDLIIKGAPEDTRIYLEESFGKPYELEGTLTKLCIDSDETILLPSILDKEKPLIDRLNKDRLKFITEDMPDQEILSWLCCPITNHKGEKFGAIKLLTFTGGEMLTRDSISISQGFSDYLYSRHKRFVSEKALLDLNKITNNLVTVSGEALEKQLVEAIELWASTYVSHDCKIAIVATTETGELFSCYSGDIYHITNRTEKINRLVLNSEDKTKESTLSGYHYISLPVEITNVENLTGFIAFLSKSSFTNEAKLQVGKAGNNISLIIYQEYLRHQSVRELARFRHAIVAPIQGLSGRAKLILRLAQKNKLADKMDEMSAAIERESNIIRNWFNISRMLGNSRRPTINKEPQDIQVLFDDCIFRYRKTALKRNIKIQEEWIYKKGCIVDFDKLAIDIALSNLIDNAVKYSYPDTALRVTFNVRGSNVVIDVINIGRKLSEDFRERFNKGLQFTWKEQSSNVAGQGIGISIVNSLIKAHDGTLRFGDRPVTQELSKGKKAYQVYFQLVLPQGPRRK
jgi:hypothetical protein